MKFPPGSANHNFTISFTGTEITGPLPSAVDFGHFDFDIVGMGGTASIPFYLEITQLDPSPIGSGTQIFELRLSGKVGMNEEHKPFTVTLNNTLLSIPVQGGLISYGLDSPGPYSYGIGTSSEELPPLDITGRVLGGLSSESENVPEPGSLILLGSGIVGISFALWPRRKKKQILHNASRS